MERALLVAAISAIASCGSAPADSSEPGTGTEAETGSESDTDSGTETGDEDPLDTCAPTENCVSFGDQFGTAAIDAAMDCVHDATGHLYVVGYTAGVLPDNASAGQADSFIAKYCHGDRVWLTQFGSSSTDEGRSVATQDGRGIHVAGRSGNGVFLAKFDSYGEQHWQVLLDWQPDDGPGVAVDSSGSVYVAGSEEEPGNGPEGSRLVLAKFDSEGEELWRRTYIEPNRATHGHAVAVDSRDAVVVVGATETLNEQDEEDPNDPYLLLVKYDSDGTLIWDQPTISTLGNAADLAIDLGDNIAVVGDALGDDQAVMQRMYSPAGTFLWSTPMTSPELEYGAGVAVRENGEVLFTGGTQGALDGELNHGATDGFITKIESDGEHAWTRLVGTAGVEQANGIAVAGEHDVYVVGSTNESWSADSSGEEDVFVMRACGN